MPKSKEFISSSEGSDCEPERKKKKKEHEKKAEKEKTKEEKPKSKPASSSKKDGEHMFQIAKMRYVNVSEFRGRVMVSIREYYDADGELRPGKKGISLSLDQWKSLRDHIDEIDEAVKEMT